MTTTITLNTHDYGPTGFEVTLSAEGEVISVTSAAAQLPEMVFRLTYGDRWESAREHFQRLAENVAYRVEAAAWLNDVLPEYKLLRRAFRKVAEKKAPQEGPEAPLHAQRVNFWLAHPEARPALFLQKKSYNGFKAVAELLRRKKVKPAALEPWLFSLINLLHHTEDRRHIYRLIALLGTRSATGFILSELERQGRHPYASALLGATEELATPDNRERILALYPSLARDVGQVKDYLRVIGRLRGEEVHQIIIAILHDHSSLADNALAALRSTEHPAPGAVIRERFNEEDNLFMLDLIAELIDDEPEGIRISLEDMNAKIDKPALNAAAPVTWPQMLGPNWARLVQAADEEAIFSLVSRYLERDEPWLQRCALLQLDTWVQAQNSPPAIPLSVERRMQQLINSRYEKVYTVALNIAEKIFDQLAEPGMMVDVVLRHAYTSGYRLMNAAVLKKAAHDPALKAQQITRLRTALFRASKEELDNLKRIIPYLRFLGAGDLLHRLAGERNDVLTGSAR